MEGEFPEITWREVEGALEGIEYSWELGAIAPFHVDYDGIPELALINVGQLDRDERDSTLVVYKNYGSFEEPDWQQGNEIFPDLPVPDDFWWFNYFPQFCDWGGEVYQDLIVGQDNRYFWFEMDEDGDYVFVDDFEFTHINYRGLMGFQLADFNHDGVLDILAIYDVCIYWDNYIIINNGTAEEPEWAEPVAFRYNYSRAPTIYDINEDGYADIIGGMKYLLNNGSGDPNGMWEREIRWRTSLQPDAAFYDFEGDGQLELIQGFDYSIYGDHDSYWWRLGQYERTERGWEDAQFFGDDFFESGDGDDSYISYRRLCVEDPFGDGNPCLVNATEDGFAAYQDQDESEAFDWQPVDAGFEQVLDTSQNVYYQLPEFEDLDGDGDVDMLLLTWASVDRMDTAYAEAFEMERDGDDIVWLPNYDWTEGIAQVRFTMLQLADLDGDGDLDLVSTVNPANGVENEYRLYLNTGNRQLPEWSLTEDALPEDDLYYPQVVHTADVDGDGKPDILTRNTCFLNQTPWSTRDQVTAPLSFGLEVYPNPFNGSAALRYGVESPGRLALNVYSGMGQLVYSRDLGWLNPGIFNTTLPLTHLPSGMYVVQLGSREKRVVLMK
jgi:hypothetical protein